MGTLTTFRARQISEQFFSPPPSTLLSKFLSDLPLQARAMHPDHKGGDENKPIKNTDFQKNNTAPPGLLYSPFSFFHNAGCICVSSCHVNTKRHAQNGKGSGVCGGSTQSSSTVISSFFFSPPFGAAVSCPTNRS